MDNKFIEAMEKRSDSELLEIVTKLRNDYQPEAVEAAELVIKNRNLSTDQIEQAKQEIKEKEISKTLYKLYGYKYDNEDFGNGLIEIKSNFEKNQYRIID